MFLWTIKSIELSTHMFKETRQFNEDMENKNYSGRLSYVHTYSDTFRHIQKLFRHIWVYSGLCVNLAYSEPEGYSDI